MYIQHDEAKHNEPTSVGSHQEVKSSLPFRIISQFAPVFLDTDYISPLLTISVARILSASESSSCICKIIVIVFPRQRTNGWSDWVCKVL